MTADDYHVYVGIDWATESHRVRVLDANGRLRKEQTVAHTGPALTALVEDLASLVGGDLSRVAVAIEVPRGAIVDVLLEAGAHVFSVNPKQLDRFRDRYSVAGAKDDSRDAHVLGATLRTDRHAFRRLQPEDPRLIQLRELSRAHSELVQEHTRLTHRLRDQLLRFYPQVLALCPAADEPWLWALLAQAPTPAAGRRQSLRAVRALLRAQRIRRIPAEALHEALQHPALPVAPGTAEAASEHVALLLPRLRLVHAQQAQCERRLETLLAALTEATPEDGREHRDAEILRSLPGVGRVVAATMLAEASRPLAAREYQTVRAQTGVAPVTRQSGKHAVVLMRRACNHRLRNAVYQWTLNSLRWDARCRAHYRQLRQRHGHARALRGVADRLLRILFAMLTAGTLYDPTRHAAKTPA
jgi:transposase